MWVCEDSLIQTYPYFKKHFKSNKYMLDVGRQIGVGPEYRQQP